MSQCRSCGAEIEWIKTPAGKAHPVDAKPIKVWQQTESGPDAGRWHIQEGYTSHFATCPNADQHRKSE